MPPRFRAWGRSVLESMTELNISKDALFKEIGYTPHAAQKLYHDSRAKYKIACCGRRFGKSFMVGHEMTARMFSPDRVYWIVGPTYDLGEKEFRVVFNDMFQPAPRGLGMGGYKGIRKQYNKDQGNMRIQMPWNTVLEVKSADKQDALIGEGLDHVIMAEAATHRKDTWEMFIEPALLDKKGSADFVSTPRGHNWYEDIWLLGQDEDHFEFESWRFPTWANTAKFPKGENQPELQAIKRRVSEYHWLQEYCAEFTALEGRIYNEFDRVVHVVNVEYNPFWKNYQFFDFGFADPFVCLDVMVDPSSNVYVWREYMVRRKTNQEHGLALSTRESPAHFHVDGRFGDPGDPDAMRTLNFLLPGVPIIGRRLPVDRGISGWHQGIEVVKQWLRMQPNGQPKLYIDRSCANLIRQMEHLQTAPEKEGKNTREGQKDYDDHGPDALRYGMSELFILGYQRDNLSAVYGRRPEVAPGPFSYESILRLDELNFKL
jgi:hypothetical protein